VFCQTAPENHICPAKYPDGTVFKAELSGPLLFQYGFRSLSCTGSKLEGTIKGGTVVWSTYTITSCGSVISEIINKSSWSFPWTEGTHNAGKLSGGTEWKFTQGGITCVYQIPGLSNSGVTLTGGKPARININAYISKVSGGTFCSSPAEMSTTYTVTSPSPLYVEKE
jgi:hypothetical protein